MSKICRLLSVHFVNTCEGRDSISRVKVLCCEYRNLVIMHETYSRSRDQIWWPAE